jgi:hypothetical protein
MKNKLLLTSALAGSLMFNGISLAQTTVSGSLDLSFKAVSSDGTGVKTGSAKNDTYIGKESQINIANKGKLNNGLDYAAGFSLEYDGNDGTDTDNTRPAFSNTHNENVFIDFISGNTTFTIGVDHIQNSDRTLGVLIGEDAEDFADGINGTTSGLSISSVGSDPASTYGVGIMQKTPVGTFSAYYTPKSGNRNQEATSNDASFIAVDNGDVDGAQSATELGFVGDLGVKGLSTHLFYNKREAMTTATTEQDVKGINIGASYNVGQITGGINRKKVDTKDTGIDNTQMEYSVAYAATKELSIGLNYSKADKDGSTTDEKVKSIAVGYNMGPVVLVGQYGKVDGKNGSVAESAEGDVLYLQLSTKF